MFIKNPTQARTRCSDPEDSVKKLVPAPHHQRPKRRGDNDDATLRREPQDQVTPLAARLFATYTFVISVVRLYAAYHLAFAPLYQLGIMTFVVAWAHFVSELVVFKTQRLGRPQMLPLGFATCGIVWMASQYSFYVEA